jgi:hypothetical protein
MMSDKFYNASPEPRRGFKMFWPVLLQFSSPLIPLLSIHLGSVGSADPLSPYLGERMLPFKFLKTPVVMRELLPQDLKLEMDQLTRQEAIVAARYLASVRSAVRGRAMWCRQIIMNCDSRRGLGRNARRRRLHDPLPGRARARPLPGCTPARQTARGRTDPLPSRRFHEPSQLPVN